jgi:uncharacterized protein
MELCLVPNLSCNLRCDYCYLGEHPSRHLSLELAQLAVQYALERDRSGLTLSFFGGEPLLRMPFIETITEFARAQLAAVEPNAKLEIHLNTNASLVDDRVEAYVRRQNAVQAFVSLDGPAPVHDRHRQDAQHRGSHAAVRAGLERLAAAGAQIGVLAVVNPDTAAALGETTAELFELPVARANVACNLRAAWDTTAVANLRDGLRSAIEVWKRAFRAGRAVHFEPLTTKVLSHLFAAMPCGSRCQFGADELVVAPSGRFYTCGELVGDDTDPSLSIRDLEHGIDWAKLTALREQKQRIEAHCRDCEIQSRCSSSCGCKHVALTGTFGQITSTLCDTEAAFIEAADAAAAALYAEQSPAFIEFFYRKQWAPTAAPRFVPLRRAPS